MYFYVDAGKFFWCAALLSVLASAERLAVCQCPQAQPTRSACRYLLITLLTLIFFSYWGILVRLIAVRPNRNRRCFLTAWTE